MNKPYKTKNPGSYVYHYETKTDYLINKKFRSMYTDSCIEDDHLEWNNNLHKIGARHSRADRLLPVITNTVGYGEERLDTTCDWLFLVRSK